MKKECQLEFSEASLIKGIFMIIKDNINRKKLLFPNTDNELEIMQEEFKKSDKISVKIIKSKNLFSNIDNSGKKVEKKLINSKKKKDIITIDNKSDYIPESSNDKVLKINQVLSIFNSEVNSNIENLSNKIDMKTGLPSVFKVEKIDDKINNKIYKEKELKFGLERKKKLSLFKENFENEEYKQIHDKNFDLIKNLSGEELLKYSQEIKTLIPKELLKKMEDGYFQKNLDKKNLTSMIYSQQDLNDKYSEEEKEEEEDEINNNYDETNVINLKEGENKKDVYLFNYYKSYKKISSLEDTFNNPLEINYQKINMNDLELSEKYFSLKEIYNFLSSTLDSHINIGLKLLTYIFELFYSKELDNKLRSFLIENFQQINFYMVLLYLLENKNRSIRLKSIEIIIFIMKYILEEYITKLKDDMFLYCNFPLITIREKKYILNQVHLEQELDLINELISRIDLIFIHVRNDVCNILNYSKNYELIVYLKFLKLLSLIDYKLGNLFYNSELFDKLISIISYSLQNNNLSICKKTISILFYMSFKDINKIRTILEKLYKIGNCNNDNKFLSLLNKFEYIHLIYENRFFNQNYFLFCVNRFLESDNYDLIYSNCLFKLINEENLSFFSELSNKILEYNKLKKYSYLKDKSVKNIELWLKSIDIITKLFRYMQNREEDIKIIDNENDLVLLVDMYNEITDSILSNITSSRFNEKINKNFYMLKILLMFFKTAKKYPKIITYMKLKNLNIVKSFHSMYENLLHHFKIINDLKKESKIFYLNRLRNLINFSFETLNYISKFRSENEDILTSNSYSEILYIIPSFFNVLEQYKILKYCNNLTSFFIFKLEKNPSLKSFYEDTKYDIRSNIEELYLYMGSNEDYRKSKILNEIMYYTEKISQISIELTEKDWIFLPVDKNYFLQILFKDNYDSEAKLKLLTLFVMIFYNEKHIDSSIINSYDFLLVILKTFYSFKDVIFKNRAEMIYNFYISSLVIKRKDIKAFTNHKSFILSNQDIDLVLEDLRLKYEFPNQNYNTSYFAKLLLIWFASINNTRINKFNLLFMLNFAIYKDFYEEKNLVNENDIISNIINNKDIIFLDFIENLVIIERKYLSKTKEKDPDKNIIYQLISKIKNIINIVDDESIETVHNKISKFLIS